MGGGEWKAQFTYDQLRTSIDEQKKHTQEAADKAKVAQSKLDETKDKMAAAKSESAKTEAEAKAASKASDDADKKVKELIGSSDGQTSANATEASGSTESTDGIAAGN